MKKYGVCKFNNIMGVTCYMNSILHILQQIPIFVKYIINLSNLNNNHIIYELNNIFIISHNNDDQIITPINFKNKIGEVSSMWNEYNQQDSQEFLNFIISQIETEIGHKGKFISKFKNIKMNKNIDKKVILNRLIGFYNYYNYKINEYSFIKEIFTGLIKNVKICSCCNSKTFNYESFNTLPLSLNNNIKNIYQCFDLFIIKEKLDEYNKLNCKFCGKINNGYSESKLWKTPKILIIHLKRFDINSNKININIDYPIEQLDISKYFDINSPYKNKSKYNLLGINLHYGTTDFGHYTSIIKNMYNNNWCLYNDHNEVLIINNNNLVNENSYLLFYELI